MFCFFYFDPFYSANAMILTLQTFTFFVFKGDILDFYFTFSRTKRNWSSVLTSNEYPSLCLFVENRESINVYIFG